MVIANPNPFPYTAGAPVVSGLNITVDRYLKSPTLLLKTLEDITSAQFVSDYLFRSAGANGGHILYDVAAAQDLYLDIDANLQPQSVLDGTSFPEVATDELTSQVATAVEYGGQFHLTYTEVRRDQRDLMGRKLTRLGNTLVKNSDDRNLKLLTDAATAGTINHFSAASAWNGATPSFIADVSLAQATVNSSELNYTADTAIGHPITLAGILAIKDLFLHLPRESTQGNPLLNPTLNGLLGLNWVSSRRWPQNRIGILERGVIGAVASEMAPWTKAVPDDLLRQWTVMGARVEVPIITDPGAMVIIDAVNG